MTSSQILADPFMCGEIISLNKQGCTDIQIADMLGSNPRAIHSVRSKLGIASVYKDAEAKKKKKAMAPHRRRAKIKQNIENIKPLSEMGIYRHYTCNRISIYEPDIK